jgi:hypothetical protein
VSGRTVYLDATAIGALVLGGAGAGELTAALRGTGTRATSIISGAEVPRAAALRDAAAVARAMEVMTRLSVIQLDGAVVAQAATLRPATLRAADAIQVASAMLLADSLDAFLTYDPGIAEAARGANLRVESPGVELAAGPVDAPPSPTAGSVDEALLMRVVDRMVGRLRPDRIIAPEGAMAQADTLHLAMVPGPWSPGRGASWVAQEAIEDLDIRLDLVLVDEDTPEPPGRTLYQLP